MGVSQGGWASCAKKLYPEQREIATKGKGWDAECANTFESVYIRLPRDRRRTTRAYINVSRVQMVKIHPLNHLGTTYMYEEHT